MPRNHLVKPPTRCLVMGIINVTPDSFSGDGLRQDGMGHQTDFISAAISQARSFVANGADILDIGGESTRPGAEQISVQQELARIEPVIQAIRSDLPEVAISIDTYKATVASAALSSGADIVNDVWALRADPQMADIVRGAGCPVILMHNRSIYGRSESNPKLGGSHVAPDYGSAFLSKAIEEMQDMANDAIAAGIHPYRIILDPGVGFGKTPSQNMALIEAIDLIRELGFPVLLGASRKSFMGKVLDLPAEDRLETTLATTALAVQRGASIVRVHDVAENAKVVQMTEAMLSAGKKERHNAG